MKKIWSFIILLFWVSGLTAQNINNNLLIDKANLFSEHELKQLNKKLTKFNEKTKGNILIYVDKKNINTSIENVANGLMSNNLNNQPNSMVIVVFTESNEVKIQLSQNLKTQFDDQKIALAENELKRDYFSKGEYYRGIKNLVTGFTGSKDNDSTTENENKAAENETNETSIISEKPSNYVTDDVSLLSKEQLTNLNAKLKQLENETSHQVFIYLGNSLNGNGLEETTQYLFDSWKVGQEGKDNGVLIAIFLKDRKFRIQTGYGLEATLPDLVCENIQDEFIIPNFKNEDYYAGLDEATTAIISILKGDNSLKFIHPKKFRVDTNVLVWMIILFIIVALMTLYNFQYFKYPESSVYKKRVIYLISTYGFSLMFMSVAQFFIAKQPNYKHITENILFLSLITIINYITLTVSDEEIKNKITKKVNLIFLATLILVSNIVISLLLFYFTESLNNGIDAEAKVYKYITFFVMANGGVMIIYLMFSKSSAGGSSSSYSIGGSSYSSSSSSSSFSGGGGGRSGGGGSSGSW